MNADFQAANPTVTSRVVAQSFIAHRVRSRAWFRLLATPVVIYAAYRLGSLAFTIIHKQPVFGVVFLVMTAMLLALGLCGGVFNIIRGSLPATLSIGPKGLSYEEGKHRTLWAWPDLHDVHLEHTRGGSRITFRNGSSTRRKVLPGEWDSPTEVIYRRLKSALLGDFGVEDQANSSGVVPKPHGMSLTNIVYLCLAATPFAALIVAVVALVGTSNHNIHEDLRLGGAVSRGTISNLECVTEQRGCSYLVSYNFLAVDPESMRPRVFTDSEFIGCTLFYSLHKKQQILVVFDPKQPHNTRIDFGHTFERGMSDDAFQQIWRPPFDAPRPGCY